MNVFECVKWYYCLINDEYVNFVAFQNAIGVWKSPFAQHLFYYTRLVGISNQTYIICTSIDSILIFFYVIRSMAGMK